jgi:hypothetical protein
MQARLRVNGLDPVRSQGIMAAEAGPDRPRRKAIIA